MNNLAEDKTNRTKSPSIPASNDVRMIRGFLKSTDSLKNFLTEDIRQRLRGSIVAHILRLGWGYNRIIVQFDWYDQYSLWVITVYYLRLEENKLKSATVIPANPLPYENPEVSFIADTIITPLVKKFLGDAISFTVSTE